MQHGQRQMADKDDDGTFTFGPFSTKMVMGPDGFFVPVSSNDPRYYDDDEKTVYKWKPPVCECGSEKTYGKGTNLHSEWCPLKRRY